MRFPLSALIPNKEDKMKDYHGSLGNEYIAYSDDEPSDADFGRFGFTAIPILEFLWDRKWDEIALAYCHALNPTYIRVTTGDLKMDSRTGRITVYVDEEDTILYMEQEVEVGLPDEIKDGAALDELVGLHSFDFGDPDENLFKDE